MHTPEQAQNLWCPMARVGVMPSAGGPADINDPTTEYRGSCIAGQCAMWRWEYRMQLDANSPAGILQLPTKAVKTGLGYCGLAGRPEVRL